MKKFLASMALLAIIASPCFAIQSQSTAFGLSDGQTIKQYDKNGSYQGYYRQNGSQTKEYNKTGSYQGYYRQNGNTVKHYDKTGSYQGYYRK
jgi:hypothetical protein